MTAANNVADLKFLEGLQRAQIRNLKLRSGVESINLPVPPLFPNFVSVVPE
jgi:hypothetical protein